MEIRRIYKQSQSSVIVIPSKYMRALKWKNGEQILISLLPNNRLTFEKVQEKEQPVLIV